MILQPDQIVAQIAPEGANDILAGSTYTYLENCLKTPSGFPPEMLVAWRNLAPLIRPESQDPLSDPKHEPDYFQNRLNQYQLVHQRFSTFKSEFSEHIDKTFADALESVISLTDTQSNCLKSSRLFLQGDQAKTPVERIALYHQAIEVYAQCVLGSISQAMYLKACNSIPEPAVDRLIDLAESLLIHLRDTSDSLLAKIAPLSVEYDQAKQLVHRIQVQIKASFWDIHRITQGVEPLGLMLSIGEPYPIVIESASAEGKAICRLRDAQESDWVAEPNTTVDVDDLDAQLRACGYIN
jgi:hypothetical protein